jgi:hypothetical protein
MPEGLPPGPENSLKRLRDRIETWAKEHGDTAMGLAIRAALPTTEHLLCIFHIRSPLLLSRTSEWKEASKIFWQLGKNSDSSGKQTFDAQFEALVNVVQQKPRRMG